MICITVQHGSADTVVTCCKSDERSQLDGKCHFSSSSSSSLKPIFKKICTVD